MNGSEQNNPKTGQRIDFGDLMATILEAASRVQSEGKQGTMHLPSSGAAGGGITVGMVMPVWRGDLFGESSDGADSTSKKRIRGMGDFPECVNYPGTYCPGENRFPGHQIPADVPGFQIPADVPGFHQKLITSHFGRASSRILASTERAENIALLNKMDLITKAEMDELLAIFGSSSADDLDAALAIPMLDKFLENSKEGTAFAIASFINTVLKNPDLISSAEGEPEGGAMGLQQTEFHSGEWANGCLSGAGVGATIGAAYGGAAGAAAGALIGCYVGGYMTTH